MTDFELQLLDVENAPPVAKKARKNAEARKVWVVIPEEKGVGWLVNLDKLSSLSAYIHALDQKEAGGVPDPLPVKKMPPAVYDEFFQKHGLLHQTKHVTADAAAEDPRSLDLTGLIPWFQDCPVPTLESKECTRRKILLGEATHSALRLLAAGFYFQMPTAVAEVASILRIRSAALVLAAVQCPGLTEPQIGAIKNELMLMLEGTENIDPDTAEYVLYSVCCLKQKWPDLWQRARAVVQSTTMRQYLGKRVGVTFLADDWMVKVWRHPKTALLAYHKNEEKEMRDVRARGAIPPGERQMWLNKTERVVLGIVDLRNEAEPKMRCSDVDHKTVMVCDLCLDPANEVARWTTIPLLQLSRDRLDKLTILYPLQKKKKQQKQQKQQAPVEALKLWAMA